MSDQRRDYGRRPASGDTGARTQYDRSYGKKPYQGEKKGYGDGREYPKKPYAGDFRKKNDGQKGDRTKKTFDRKSDRDEKPKRTFGPAPVENERDEQPYLLIGRNAVREALKSGRSIDRILVTTEHDGSLGEIVTLARERKLVVREVDRKKLDELCMPFGHGGKTANHQGVVAYAAGVTYCEVADILDAAKEKGEAPFVIVLDGVEDPHNLGSVIRSADCAGAHGVIIGKRRSASVTAAAVKASAGATEYVKIARVVNISAAIEQLKKAGVWIAGADMNGEPMRSAAMKGPLALVIGNEGEGLSKLVRDNCDFLVSIPMQGHIDSLNAGVAAAILMFEKKRQDAE
ncbi:MAG: 23S rRNA (guanosine(2251)-2'-O)-methyltransferase RlmB [Clostridia bacterium]|nr:23S rRNA (guanosine(2251)-2'-O)-methyltransferase RlmB [Clostridia bacterium]